MNKQDFISLFNFMHPNFFESESIKSLSDDMVFDEMILPLEKFDANKYTKSFGNNISFGFYKGSIEEIKKAVAEVERDWKQYFSETDRIYCGFVDGKVASFCLIDSMGTYTVNGKQLKIGGPGCVGTLPSYRNIGIGLTTVKYATQILKDEGFDYSYIHFTGVAEWYEKLGYESIIKWSRNGIL